MKRPPMEAADAGAGRSCYRTDVRSALAVLERSLLDAAGVVSAAERRAIADGELPAGELGDYLRRVREAAYRVSDEEVAAMRRNGMSDDEIFERTICAAYGAARLRLAAGLAALDSVYDQG